MKAVSLKDLKNLLSAADYELFRRAVVVKCLITNATWSNWTLGKSTPETKYQPLIDRIAEQFGLSVFGTLAGENGGEV